MPWKWGDDTQTLQPTNPFYTPHPTPHQQGITESQQEAATFIPYHSYYKGSMAWVTWPIQGNMIITLSPLRHLVPLQLWGAVLPLDQPPRAREEFSVRLSIGGKAVLAWGSCLQHTSMSILFLNFLGCLIASHVVCNNFFCCISIFLHFYEQNLKPWIMCLKDFILRFRIN